MASLAGSRVILIESRYFCVHFRTSSATSASPMGSNARLSSRLVLYYRATKASKHRYSASTADARSWILDYAISRTLCWFSSTGTSSSESGSLSFLSGLGPFFSFFFAFFVEERFSRVLTALFLLEVAIVIC